MSELRAVDNSNNDLESFLDYLYSGLEGYVYSPTKDLDGTFLKHYYQWPEERDSLIKHIKQSTVEREVYVAPAIFSAPSGEREHFKATNVVWSDFDGDLPDDLKGLPHPSMVVCSSGEGHEHWYWKLEEPCTDRSEIETRTKYIAYHLQADLGCWNVNRVLRPPATKNHKRDKTAFLQATNSTSFPVEDFPQMEVGAEVHVEYDNSAIPDVADVILKYPFPPEAITLFRAQLLSKNAGGTDDVSTALMHLGYLCAEMGMSDVEIFSVVRNADDRWGKFKNRTDRIKRLSDLIARVRIKHPELVLEDDDVIPIFGLQSLLNTEIEIEWVIPGLLQEQGYMLFTGPSGIGKTQVSVRFAINMALGRNWLGFEIDKPRKILVYSLEMGLADIKYFLQTMTAGMSDADLAILEENLIIVPYGESIYLDSNEGRIRFESILREVNPEGVFIDSAGSTTTKPLTSEEAVKSIMDYNDTIRKKYGIFTWWIHHMRKAQGENKKPNKLDDVYGNQYIYNRATSVYCLWPEKGKIQVIPLKKRLSKVEDPWFIQRLVNLDFMKEPEIKFVNKPKTLEFTQEDTPQKEFKPKPSSKSVDLMGGM